MGSSYFPSDQMIGGTAVGAGNVIAYNGDDGVLSDSGPGDSIRGNDIFANGGLGIVAGINGVLSTYAEARSIALPDTAPVLTSAVFDPHGTVVEGSITGYAVHSIRRSISLPATLSTPAASATGRPISNRSAYLSTTRARPQFQIPLDDAVPVGQWITATATDSGGNTSQFSLAIPVVESPPPADAVGFSAPAYLVTETGGAAVVTVNRVGSTAGTATVDYTTEDGSALAGTNYTAESGTLTFDDGQAQPDRHDPHPG